MSFLKPQSKVTVDGGIWVALSLEHSRWLDYHGPSIVEGREPGSEQLVRRFVEATPDGSFVMRAVDTVDGMCTFGPGKVGVPGAEIARGWLPPGLLFEDAQAAADLTITRPV